MSSKDRPTTRPDRPEPIMTKTDWPALCAEWERIAGEVYSKTPDSPEAVRLVVLSYFIRDRLRVLCLNVDPEAMNALASMRDTLARLPGGGDNIVIGPEISTPMAHAYIAVRALWEHERTPGSGDADGYRSASWFGKKMAPRLRMAARKDRKTKRVDKRTINGVECYSVADARQWWPADVPKEP